MIREILKVKSKKGKQVQHSRDPNLHLTSHVSVDISNRKAKLPTTFDPCSSGHVSASEADGLGMRLQEENFPNEITIDFLTRERQHKHDL